MHKQFLTRSLGIALAMGFALPGAHAAAYSNGSSTATFNVSLTIQSACTISATPMTFTATGALSTAQTAQTTVAATCSNTTPYNIGLDGGNVTGSTVSTRLLGGTAAGNTGSAVNFQLYTDTNRTTVWGNTQGTDTVGGTGNGAAQSITVYGQIPAQTTPRPDTYQATVTATVYF